MCVCVCVCVLVCVCVCSGYTFTSHRAKAEYGVSSAGFSTTVQPAASAGASFLVIIAFGKFHWKKHKSNHLQV